MPQISAHEHAAGITIESAGWVLEHARHCGGAWSSIAPAATKQNLLAAPFSSALAMNSASGETVPYLERCESAPSLRIENNSNGVAVIAEGAFRSPDGRPLPVGYRRRTDYSSHGLIWTSLEIMSDVGCGGVTEFHAASFQFASAFERLFARFHPSQAGTPELFGAQGWYPGAADEINFQSRFTPLQLSFFASNGLALEFLAPSELSNWDHTLKPDAGLGLYQIYGGANVTLAPYSVLMGAPISFKGTLNTRLGLVLPDLSITIPAPAAAPLRLPASATARDVEAAAGPGVTLAFENPSAADPSLKQLTEAAHKKGSKIFAAFSLNEIAAEDAYYPRVKDWMHMASPALGPIARNVRGDGTPAGAMLCLKSGWFDELKNRIDSVWRAAEWDGLHLYDASFHPCRHPAHSGGPAHTDAENFIALLYYARNLTGAKTLTVETNALGAPSLFAGNIADALVVTAETELAFAPGRSVVRA